MLIRLIAEAISIADTVIVLSKRPTKIKKIIDIHMTNKSSPIFNRNCPEFNNYYQEIWKVFDHEI